VGYNPNIHQLPTSWNLQEGSRIFLGKLGFQVFLFWVVKVQLWQQITLQETSLFGAFLRRTGEAGSSSRDSITHPKCNSSPLMSYQNPKGKDSSSNHHFSGASCQTSGVKFLKKKGSDFRWGFAIF